MVQLLHELMPELEEVGALPEGRPRPLHELGRVADEIGTGDWLLPVWEQSESMI